MNSALIGKRIRTIREEKGWKQEVFAEKVGLSPTYIGMIERGEKIPKLETFVRIANVLNVSADLLLADVLQAELFADTSARAAAINALDPAGRERIYDVIDTLLRHEKKDPAFFCPIPIAKEPPTLKGRRLFCSQIAYSPYLYKAQFAFIHAR